MLRVELPLEQWRLIATALGEMPAKTSMGLILAIDQQIQAQLAETAPAAAPASPPGVVETPADEETFGKRKP